MAQIVKLQLIKKYFSGGFYALLVIFLLINLRKFDFSELKGLNVSLLYLGISSLLALAFRYLGSYIWLQILKDLGETKIRNYVTLVYVYSKAWLGRYIPGTLPWILGKIHFASQQGLSKTKLAISSILEGLLQTMVLLILSVGFLLLDNRLDILQGKTRILMLAFLVAGTFFLYPPFFNYVFGVAYKRYKKQAISSEHRVKPRLVVKGVLLYSIGFVISGVSYFYLVKSFYPNLEYANLLFLVGAFNLSGALGTLSIFPGGLGVREGVQFLFLGLIMPAEITLIIVVMARVWSIAMDLLFFGINRLAIKLRPGESG